MISKWLTSLINGIFVFSNTRQMNSIQKLTLLLLAIFTITSYANGPDWGATGHRAVGEIADGYLTKKAKRNIEKLLGGESLALVSTFGDDIKSDRAYSKYYTWHFVNMPFDEKYEDTEKNPEGDLVVGIEKCIAVLKDENASKEDKVFHLKMLVHFMGDLHQPMHVGLKEDKGGNDFQVQWFRSGTNLHSVWDSKMINHFNMSYTELASNESDLSKMQVEKLQEGTVTDWLNETHEYAVKAYKSAEKGENLGYRYMYDNFHIVRSQLQKGGIRLAKVLNDLFS